MALEPVQEIQPTPKKGAGGVFGLVGGLAGAVIGAAASGGNPSGITSGYSMGSTAGGLIDANRGPKHADQPVDNTPLIESKPIQTMQDHPEVQLAQLQDAKAALTQAGSIPGMSYDEAHQHLDNAINQTKQSLGVS